MIIRVAANRSSRVTPQERHTVLTFVRMTLTRSHSGFLRHLAQPLVEKERVTLNLFQGRGEQVRSPTESNGLNDVSGEPANLLKPEYLFNSQPKNL